MADTRLVTDTAHAVTKAVVHIFANLLRDEEIQDAYAEVLAVVTPQLERFAERKRRELRRLYGPPPGKRS